MLHQNACSLLLKSSEKNVLSAVSNLVGREEEIHKKGFHEGAGSNYAKRER